MREYSQCVRVQVAVRTSDFGDHRSRAHLRACPPARVSPCGTADYYANCLRLHAIAPEIDRDGLVMTACGAEPRPPTVVQEPAPVAAAGRANELATPPEHGSITTTVWIEPSRVAGISVDDP